jgi:hypothetical protein
MNKKDEARRVNGNFVLMYGLREGVILSELCESFYTMKRKPKGVSRSDCERLVWYLSKKQIRTGIQILKERGCLRVEERKEKLFSRIIYYRIEEAVYKEYIKEVYGKAGGTW